MSRTTGVGGKKQKPQDTLAQYAGLKMEVDVLREELAGAIADDDNRRAERLRLRIEAGERNMDEIEEAINRIPDPKQRVVLRRRYIYADFYRQPTWPEVAAKVYGDNDEKDMQNIYRLHGRALQSFEAIYHAIQKTHQ